MYVQHPYKYEGKYYAKIDGVFYEISKEVAMAMFAEYRNEIYRSRKWAPESEEDDQMEDFRIWKTNKRKRILRIRKIRNGNVKPRDVKSWIALSVQTAMGCLLPIWQMIHR